MSEVELLTVAKEDGNAVIRKSPADALFPERAAANAILKTASGDPAVFSDGAAGKTIPSLKAKIEPVQDLHGYDRTWAGGSRNLIDPDRLTQDGANTVWAFRENPYRFSSARTYILSLQGVPFTDLAIVDADGVTVKAVVSGGGGEYLSYKPSKTHYGMVRVRAPGLTAEEAAACCQLEVGTAPTEWVPYENVCPLSGRTSASVTHNGETITVSFPGEAGVVYGGELDLTDGTLTVNGAVVTRTLSGHENFSTRLFEAVYNPEANEATFWTFSSVPDGYTLHAGGIVAANGQVYDPDRDGELLWTSGHDPAGHYSRYGTTTTHLPVAYYWTKTNVHPGDVWYVRAWMRYTDGDNVSHEMLGDLVRVVIGEDIREMDSMFDVVAEFDACHDYFIDDLPVSFAVNDAQKGSILPYRHAFQSANFFMEGTRLYAAVPDSAVKKYENVPMQFYGELEEPVRFRLTPRQVQAVLGENRISADCGPVTVTYAADTEAVIGEGRREDRGMIAPVEDGLTATRNYPAGAFLTVGSVLYRVSAAIENGGEILPGINADETTVGEQLAALYTLIHS